MPRVPVDLPSGAQAPSAADSQRQRALQRVRALAPASNEGFQRIAALARRLFDVPDARAWLFDTNQTGAGGAAVHAECPLRDETGQRIGTLALIGRKPRGLTEHEAALLRELAGLAEHQVRLLASASTDELTQIPNRRGFRGLALQMLAACGRLHLPVALIAFDLAGLKKVNDGHGHAAGDRVLQEFARCLLLACRTADAVGRVGGDEFCVLLPDTDAAGAASLVERLRHHVALSNAARAGEPAMAFSTGTALHAGGEVPAIDVLLAEADRRLLAEKSSRAG